MRIKEKPLRGGRGSDESPGNSNQETCLSAKDTIFNRQDVEDYTTTSLL